MFTVPLEANYNTISTKKSLMGYGLSTHELKIPNFTILNKLELDVLLEYMTNSLEN